MQLLIVARQKGLVMLALVTADAQQFGTGCGAVGSLATVSAGLRDRRRAHRGRIVDSLHVGEHPHRVEAESWLWA